MNFLLGSSPVTSQPHQVRLHSEDMQSLSTERSLRHAIDEAVLLQFGKGALGGPTIDVAPLGSPTDRKSQPAVVGAVVVPGYFHQDGLKVSRNTSFPMLAGSMDSTRCRHRSSAVGRPVEVHAYADRIVTRQDGRIVAEHPRSFGRRETTYDPWHYVPVLARKPGALRNGAPFKDWVLPAAIIRVRRKLPAPTMVIGRWSTSSTRF
jgi:hypothetical protein